MSGHNYTFVTGSELFIDKSNQNRLVRIMKADKTIQEGFSACGVEDSQQLGPAEFLASFKEVSGSVFEYDEKGNITGLQECDSMTSSYWTENFFAKIALLIKGEGYICFNHDEYGQSDEPKMTKYSDGEVRFFHYDGTDWIEQDPEEDSD